MSWHSLALGFCAALLTALAPAAQACLSCGCGGSGASADLGAIGGASSLFSGGNRWLIQSGGAFRQTTGAFNERGTWNPTPVDSLLQSYQAVLGVNYFFSPAWTLGLQLPLQLNQLTGASWGSFGSLNATDAPLQTGGGLSDIQLQAAYKFWEADRFGLAAWSSLALPTGRIDPALPAETTGSGVAALSGGILALYKPPAHFQLEAPPSFWDWLTSRNGEAFVNLGYSHALNSPPSQASPFFQGQSLMLQVQGNLALFPQWVAGLGLNGQLGLWSGGSGASQLASRWRLVPSLQYEINPGQGLRAAMGADLPVLGSNSLTDVSAHLVYYQFFE